MTALYSTVLDTTDPHRAAAFYHAWLGWGYRGGEPEPDAEWIVLEAPDGRRLAFQKVAELAPVTWPDGDVPQQLHLDFLAPDLDAWRADHDRLTELGAPVLFDRSDDPEEPLRVYADPDGHPFCVFTWPGE